MDAILVTGGAGYIGSVVAELLVARGYPTVVLDNLSEGHREAVPPGAEFVAGDLNDRAMLDGVFAGRRVSAVVHMAAVALVEESVRLPLRYYRQNVAATLNLLEAMLEAGVRRMVFSSSCATYGVPAVVPITEAAPTEPVNPYGHTKLICERMFQEAHRAASLDFVSLRYFNAAGASETLGEDHHPETHLIPRVLAVAAGRHAALDIYGADYPTPDGTCVRDYIHVLDIAQAHLIALERTEPGSAAIYNLGTGRGDSVRQVVASAERVTGRRIPCRLLDRRPGDPPELVADSSRIRRELGWEPKRGLEEILRSAWQWFEGHPGGYSG
ncbi:MAG TPA: UDP-glucose 4-epimerase GalE [Candidatus Acidoferrales bacterium]|nr:UDP-glucose 4-epimerase GalE [Candidatus Acidoferrales bacterium]